MDNITNEKQEIEYLENTINKLKTQANLHYIFMLIGALVSLVALVYLIKNPTIVEGSITLFLLGIAIIIYNVIMQKNKFKRANELKQDLDNQLKNNNK